MCHKYFKLFQCGHRRETARFLCTGKAGFAVLCPPNKCKSMLLEENGIADGNCPGCPYESREDEELSKMKEEEGKQSCGCNILYLVSGNSFTLRAGLLYSRQI